MELAKRIRRRHHWTSHENPPAHVLHAIDREIDKLKDELRQAARGDHNLILATLRRHGVSERYTLLEPATAQG